MAALDSIVIDELPDDATFDPEAPTRLRDAQSSVIGDEAVAIDGFQQLLTFGSVGGFR